MVVLAVALCLCESFPPDVVAAIEECFAEAERQMRALPCAEVAADEDLGWTFERDDKWTVAVVLEGEVEWRDGHLLVPLMCQARRGLGLRGHEDETFWRTVDLDCR